MKNWGFHDLHSFKDYAGFVRLCAPDEFPVEDFLPPEEQMMLDRAFDGFRYGLNLTGRELGELPVLVRYRNMVEEAYQHYCGGRMREGFFKLQEMENLLKKVPSQ